MKRKLVKKMTKATTRKLEDLSRDFTCLKYVNNHFHKVGYQIDAQLYWLKAPPNWHLFEISFKSE